MNYLNNVTAEIQTTLKRYRLARSAPTPHKLKALFKLYKYQCRAQGAFGLAKIFK